ncbi:MAG: 3-keto-5-aminohexanoate cleavage protein [Promethearchaeota archaeon]|jgi:3-keto-5-aminohexanoate cleavage enzyme
MSGEQKIIITVATARSLIYPDVKNWAQSKEELVEDVVKCYEAGASIAHIHLPRGNEVETVKQIRERCDIIIQAGMSMESILQRKMDFDAKPEMMSVMLNHHSEHFPEARVDKLHPVKELEEYCIKLKDQNILPEWEVWHSGSIWNLNYIIENKFIDHRNPQFLTLFFNWPGGMWSPPTYVEYMHRRRFLPPNTIHSVSVMGEEQMKLLVFVLTHGGNIRVGTEDYPFIKKGIPAKSNAEIVENYVSICKHVRRDVADTSEARKILGLKSI